MPLKTTLLLLSTLASLFACTYPDYYQAEANWIREEYFTLECLSADPSEDALKMEKLKNELFKRYPNLGLSTQTLNIRMDVEERKNKDRAPIVSLKTAGHALTGTLARFEKRLPTVEDFAPIVTSPVKARIIRELKKKRLVLLVLCGQDADLNSRFMKCAEKGAKMAAEMAGKKCSIVKASLDDPAEFYLIRNIFMVKNREKKSGIFILFGKGKGLYFIDDYYSHQIILEVANQLARSTEAEAQKLEARLLLDMVNPY
jgi:hypothetical protein